MRRLLFVCPLLLVVGCDSNPGAPTAPANVIVSDSDGPPPKAKAPVEKVKE